MKVWPKNEEMRKLLRHPEGNVGFYGEGPAEWPDDAWTLRRINDGDVTTEAPAEAPVEKKAMKASKSSTE